MKKIATAVLAATLSHTAFSENSYQSIFLSYMSPHDVETLSSYVNTENLAGYIMWDVRGDMDPKTNPDTSLLGSLAADSQSGKRVNAYWTNWSVYGASAIPYDPYRIPGSSYSYSDPSQAATNTDLDDKLSVVNGLIYTFLEVASDGTVYFNDPWADLSPDDEFCQSDDTKSSCEYALKDGKAFKDSSFMGNFEAFSRLKQSHPQLRLIIAIGGYGHDESFEQLFSSSSAMKRFALSVESIISHYGIDGVDLDYENPAMTQAQSKSYVSLIQTLNGVLTDNQFISVTVLAGQDYLQGKAGSSRSGFASGVLSSIASLSHVQTIDLMTYDFHGAFDYEKDGSGLTGFLSNVYQTNGLPDGYNPQFSIDQSVQALLNEGVPASKITVGIPAYARALTGISPGDDGTGLFQNIPSDASVPRGDLDDPSCSTSLPVSSNSCSGGFSYQYLVNHMLTSGFKATDWMNNASQVYHAATAYADSWMPEQTPSYTVTINNTGTLGVVISIGGTQLNYLAPGDIAVYGPDSNPSLLSVEGNKDLSVSWSTYAGGPSGSCSALDLNADQTITVNGDWGYCG